MRTYSELITIPEFFDRYEYCKLSARIGAETFGMDRYLNQVFYKSPEWRNLRNWIITRDNAYDLAHFDRPIRGNIYIHHLNPIRAEDILERKDILMNPEYLVCVSRKTHDAIHYGDGSVLTPSRPVERFAGDTCLWR